MYLKLEMMRETRAFKVRGATNFIVALSRKERQQGVVAASGGSHAAGVAYAASRLGVPATLVLTERSPRHLRATCASYGAEVVVQGQVYNDAAAVAEEISRRTGHRFIHSYDDPFIIAGQGTVGLEIMEDLPDVDAVLVPVGGGGLLAGVGCAVKTLRPQAEVIGVEPQQAAAMALAALEAERDALQGRKVVLILTGGNIDPRVLAGGWRSVWPREEANTESKSAGRKSVVQGLD